ncbi:MAG: virulence protein SciE type [Planctomycetes bacterium]|nr:virulence protein SciE type [Planctomycetota bacterium]
MTVEQRLHEGDLDACLSELQAQVRKEPAEVKHRTFLFQLLAVLGDWDRALTQLNVAADLSPSALAMGQAYREALSCEALRRDIFAGRRTPIVFGKPDPWVPLMVEALRLGADGNHEQAAALRGDAFEAAPTTSGTINGEPFAWIADADPRLGPIFEALVEGRYVWVPFHRVQRIEIEEPADLRDIVWLPAHLTWTNGGQSVAMLPVRYPGTETCEDSMLRLARKTDWVEVDRNVWHGVGQRLWTTDVGEYALLDVREVVLDVSRDDDDGNGDASADTGAASG